MNNLVEKWKAFCEWQRRPSHIPQMVEEHHRCCTCGQEYQGNYCPCCGQSARIGRYSFKNALLLFLDVWGMGNRGMFRTLRDLILRPGYLIRDYISGMLREFKKDNPAFYWVLILFVLSLPLYLFFRKSPNIPDMRFSELFIAMVYIWAMCDIYEIVLTFFNLYDENDKVLLFLCIIPIWKHCKRIKKIKEDYLENRHKVCTFVEKIKTRLC